MPVPLWVNSSPASRLISTAGVPQKADGIAAIRKTSAWYQQQMLRMTEAEQLTASSCHPGSAAIAAAANGWLLTLSCRINRREAER